MSGPIDTLVPVPLSDLLQPGTVRSSASDRSARPLKTVCREFESLFIHHMMQQMRRTIPEAGLFSGGRAEEIYTSLLDGETAKAIAHHRSMGLSAALYRQLTALSGREDQEDR